jgi:hypothetical protein
MKAVAGSIQLCERLNQGCSWLHALCTSRTVISRGTISDRYELIMSQFPFVFWTSDSSANQSIYSGLYGHDKATGC